MKSMLRTLVLLALSLATAVSAQTLTPEQHAAEGAVRLFYAGCIVYYPDRLAFDDWVAGNRYEPFPPEKLQQLVRKPGGKAWSVNNNGVRYALVAEASDLCSVFVKEVTLEYTRGPLAKARKRLVANGLTESSKVTEKKVGKGSVKTTEYQYKDKAGKSIWTLVVSESPSAEGGYQLVMSATGKQRPPQTAEH